uniref:Uncharacterized protein n=1 Tax=viral metagenome TaxID=1070528 RepID=A0A6M3IQ53_9ZZZZ
MNIETIALIATTVLALIGAGIITKLARVVRETREFFEVLSGALDDHQITSMELASIIKEAGDIRDAAISVLDIVSKKAR